MSEHAPAPAKRGRSHVSRRRADEARAEAALGVAARLRALQSGGSPLPGPLRTDLGSRLNHDFSRVRALTAGSYRSTPKIDPDAKAATSRFWRFHLNASGGGSQIVLTDAMWRLHSNAEDAGVDLVNSADVRTRLGIGATVSISTAWDAQGSWDGYPLMPAPAILAGTRVSDWTTEILRPNHELVDEAASRTAERFVAAAGTMAVVNEDPASRAFLGSVWDITNDQQMS